MPKHGLYSFLLLCIILLNASVWANTETEPTQLPERLYTWKSKQGIPIMSGTAPSWYRNEQYPANRYPPVQVYEQGQLIDDTRENKSYTETQQLREAALQHAADLKNHQKNLNLSATQRKALQKAETLAAGIIELGMEMQEVISAWGAPKKSAMGLTDDKKLYEHWMYPDGREVFFVDGGVERYTALESPSVE